MPSWGAELLQLLRLRRALLVTTAVGLSLLGIVITLVAPGLLPPEPLVGGAVGVAACLLGVAATVAIDAGDVRVRGPRHVRATGAEIAAWVPPPGGPQALGALVRDLNRAYVATGGQQVWLVPATDGSVDVTATVEALATGLCQVGRRVLLIDLATPSPDAGVSEVLRGLHSLGEVVAFDPDLLLARVGAGAEPAVALQQVAAIIERAPSDVDVLLVALPGIDRPGVLAAAGGAREVHLLVRAGTTSRVDLIASLDALESSGAEVAVVLVDSDAPAYPLPAPRATAADDEPGAAPPPETPAPSAPAEPAAAAAPPPAPPAGPPPPARETPPPSHRETQPGSVATAADPYAPGLDTLLDVEASPAAGGERFRAALALETLAQDTWQPDRG